MHLRTSIRRGAVLRRADRGRFGLHGSVGVRERGQAVGRRGRVRRGRASDAE